MLDDVMVGQVSAHALAKIVRTLRYTLLNNPPTIESVL